MTTLELNRDIKRLAKNVKNYTNTNILNTDLEDTFKAEIKRLYYADKYFKNMNKESVLRLVRLNLRFREIPLHYFGAHIDI